MSFRPEVECLEERNAANGAFVGLIGGTLFIYLQNEPAYIVQSTLPGPGGNGVTDVAIGSGEYVRHYYFPSLAVNDLVALGVSPIFVLVTDGSLPNYVSLTAPYYGYGGRAS